MDLISITEKAKEKIKEYSVNDKKYLKVVVESGGCAGLKYSFKLTETACPEDIVIDNKVLIDFRYSEIFKGSELDFVDETFSSGFKFNNPNAKSSCGCNKSFGL